VRQSETGLETIAQEAAGEELIGGADIVGHRAVLGVFEQARVAEQAGQGPVAENGPAKAEVAANVEKTGAWRIAGACPRTTPRSSLQKSLRQSAWDRTSPTSIRQSSLAACKNGSPLHARSPASPRSSCSTVRPQVSIPS